MTDVEELAKSNLSMCCGTLCQPKHIKDYVRKLEEENEMLKETLSDCLAAMNEQGLYIHYDS